MTISTLAHLSPAQAWPEWSSFRLENGETRESFSREVLLVLDKVPDEGFVTKRLRFCTKDVEIWETSIHSSCASTAAAALKHKWPPAFADEGFNFAWVAYARFVRAFCEVHQETSCVTLKKFDALPVLETPDSKREPTSWIPKLLELAFGPYAQAQAGVCKFDGDSITTKKGNTIFVDFGVQPSVQHTSLLSQVAENAASDQATDTAIRDGLDYLNSMGKVLVTNYKNKIPAIKEHLTKDKATWIATELTESDLGDAKGTRLGQSFDQLRSQLQSRKVSADAAKDALTIGACPGAAVCHWLHDKNVRKSTTLVALESNDYKTQALDQRRQEFSTFQELETVVSQGRLTKNELDQIRREIANLHQMPEPPDQKAISRARTRYSVPEVSKAMVSLYEGVVARKKNVEDREIGMAKRLMEQSGNGLVSFNRGRRDAIISALEDACEGPKPAPPAKTTKPAAKKPSKPTTK